MNCPHCNKFIPATRVDLGKLVRHLRGDMTVREFGEKVGMSSAYVSQLELGHNKNITLDKLTAILKSFPGERKFILEVLGLSQPDQAEGGE